MNLSRNRILVLAVCLLLSLTTIKAIAIQEFCDVYVGTEKVFEVSNTHLMSALERGQMVNDSIQSAINSPAFDANDLDIRTGIDGVPVIFAGDKTICSVTPTDAEQAGMSQQLLAQQWVLKLKKKFADLQQSQAATGNDSTQGDSAAVGTTGKAGDSGQKPKKRSSAGLSEHSVLLLFIEITLLLSASLLCGEIMVRLGQPSIIGQILAGLLLGQTFFGALFPDLSAQIFPRDGSQSRLIEVISWIGVSFLLMLTGMETDIAMLRRLGKPLLCFGLIGLFVPLVVGSGVSLLMPAELIGDAQNNIAFAVFLGTVFAASSVPVVAKILMDLKMFKLSIGQLAIATALAHDLLCCLLLAVIVVLSGSSGEGGNPVMLAIMGTACFLALTYFGRPAFFAILRWINDKVSSSDGLITSMIVLLLACAAATQALGIHIVLGAFASGVILSQAPVINHKVVRPLEIVTMAFFAPIFFASSGLNVNLTTLLEPGLLTITILLSLATVAVKLVSCYWAGKVAGYGKWESLAVGVGGNTKGSLGLILAMLGLSLGIISQNMYAVVIFIALFSTAVAAPLMKFFMARVKVTDDEVLRMKQDERRSRTILSSIRRVLWPTSGRGRNKFIAKLLNSIGKTQVIETTALWVRGSDDHDTEKPFASIKSEIKTQYVNLYATSVQSDEPLKAISEEGNRGYDLILMATEDPPGDSEFVFGQMVDGVILNTSTRVLVVYEPNPETERVIKKVLIPVSGNEISITAAEFGISLAKSLGAKVVCLQIIESQANELYGDKTQSGVAIERNLSDEVTNTLSELANALNVEFESMTMQTAAHAAQAAIVAVQQQNIDLIVLGAEPKVGKGLFIGHTINFILRHAPCAVAVLKLRG